MRVLVIEDERRMAQQLRKGLEFEGYTVLLAHDGESGLALARTVGHDLLILDWMLPKLDGREVARRIRFARIETLVTFSLDRLGISGARIDMLGRWEDSAVTDPVTGRERNLSNRIRREFQMDFRHNVADTLWAWGGKIATSSPQPFFGLDEFVSVDQVAGSVDMDVFVETTRWLGVRLRLQAGNVFNRRFERDRLVWSGARERTPLLFGEFRSRTRGHSVELAVTGSF